MKAAVIYSQGDAPQYTDIDEPAVQEEGQLLVTMRAAAIKHLDRSVASGKHYSAGGRQHARIIGGDGVGIQEDGTRVFALGISGMAAEKAIIEKSRMVVLPSGIDDITAAALPNAVAGSAMALLYRANIQEGDTILINGATGFTGKIAVQVAKHYGAGKIIVTGRNEATLLSLLSLGASETVPLQQTDEAIKARFKAIHQSSPIDIVIDYLWGHTAEIILGSLKGKGSFTHRTRFVSIGAVTGDTIQLSAENLRSVDLQLSGSGLGSWTKEQVQALFTDILPKMFQLVAAGRLKVDTISIGLKDIASLWNMQIPDGKRLVVAI